MPGPDSGAPWSSGSGPVLGAEGSVTVIDGTTFCVSGRSGDVRPGTEHGFFHRDTRFLDTFLLLADDHPVEPLSVVRESPFHALFVARQRPAPGLADSTVLIVRDRRLDGFLREEITVRNVSARPLTLTLRIEAGSDMADLFAVKEGRAEPALGLVRAVTGTTTHFELRRDARARSVAVHGDGGRAEPGSLTWELQLAPRSEETVVVEVHPSVDGVGPVRRYLDAAAPRRGHDVPSALVRSADVRLDRLVAAGLIDLASLRIADPDAPGREVVAAGAPWFMTLFGRDALLTSWMVLPFDPRLALDTVRTLADLQGRACDPQTEEEPGKVLHEVRSSLDVANVLGGRDVYYGSVDATPLFVMVVGELLRWGASRDDVAALLPAVDRCLEWIDSCGDRDGDGFVEYARMTDGGLLHQGWKDSFDAVTFADGRPAEGPIALAEVQAYVYAAHVARAELADAFGDAPRAAEQRRRAAALRQAFDAAFWMDEVQCYAMALDGQKRRVDVVTSNVGHCLWAGIVPPARAAALAEHLLAPEMFTGFGVRTLATSAGAYNPMSYHNGSVWPHDSAIVASGLMRYGFADEAQRIVGGLLDASEAMHGRMPELFCGFARDEFGTPVPYPTACSPQAWSAAAVLLCLRALLRLDVDAADGAVWCAPEVPVSMRPLVVRGVRAGSGRFGAVEVGADDWDVDGLPAGLSLRRAPRPVPD